MVQAVAHIQLARHRRSFSSLRSCDERSIVAAYRYGMIADEYHRNGWTYQELGDDVDRHKNTVKLYVKLFNSYDTEKDLLDTARAMKTYQVSRLASTDAAQIALGYQLSCKHCGSHEIKRTRKKKEDESTTDTAPVVIPQFKAANS